MYNGVDIVVEQSAIIATRTEVDGVTGDLAARRQKRNVVVGLLAHLLGGFESLLQQIGSHLCGSTGNHSLNQVFVGHLMEIPRRSTVHAAGPSHDVSGLILTVTHIVSGIS